MALAANFHAVRVKILRAWTGSFRKIQQKRPGIADAKELDK